jgi:hypothetical protein
MQPTGWVALAPSSFFPECRRPSPSYLHRKPAAEGRLITVDQISCQRSATEILSEVPRVCGWVFGGAVEQPLFNRKSLAGMKGKTVNLAMTQTEANEG